MTLPSATGPTGSWWPEPPPPVLLISGSGTGDCNGVYTIRGEEVHESLPVWQRQDPPMPKRWMYSTTQGYWIVAGSRTSFEKGNGWLCTGKPHDGRMPHNIAEWEHTAGTGVDTTILIRGGMSVLSEGRTSCSPARPIDALGNLPMPPPSAAQLRTLSPKRNAHVPQPLEIRSAAAAKRRADLDERKHVRKVIRLKTDALANRGVTKGGRPTFMRYGPEERWKYGLRWDGDDVRRRAAGMTAAAALTTAEQKMVDRLWSDAKSAKTVRAEKREAAAREAQEKQDREDEAQLSLSKLTARQRIRQEVKRDREAKKQREEEKRLAELLASQPQLQKEKSTTNSLSPNLQSTMRSVRSPVTPIRQVGSKDLGMPRQSIFAQEVARQTSVRGKGEGTEDLVIKRVPSQQSTGAPKSPGIATIDGTFREGTGGSGPRVRVQLSTGRLSITREIPVVDPASGEAGDFILVDRQPTPPAAEPPSVEPPSADPPEELEKAATGDSLPAPKAPAPEDGESSAAPVVAAEESKAQEPADPTPSSSPAEAPEVSPTREEEEVEAAQTGGPPADTRPRSFTDGTSPQDPEAGGESRDATGEVGEEAAKVEEGEKDPEGAEEEATEEDGKDVVQQAEQEAVQEAEQEAVQEVEQEAVQEAVEPAEGGSAGEAAEEAAGTEELS